MDYKSAGVNIESGNALVKRIQSKAKESFNAHVLNGIGGFSGLMSIPEGYRSPVLVSCTDGVGTKLKLLVDYGLDSPEYLKQIGQDLVAMSVNDLIVMNAKPLFFLDYLSTGHLDINRAAFVIEGIVDACKAVDCALIGGETAEMPDMYAKDDFDLAGFCVGIAERDQICEGKSTEIGDRILGIHSSGFHSNGYSLVRHLLKTHAIDPRETRIEERSLLDILLTPTFLYVKPVLALFEALEVRAVAHITGGGLVENIPRVLKSGLSAQIDESAWQWPAVFEWMMSLGVERSEMRKVFNCGIGMTVIVPETVVAQATKILTASGFNVSDIGVVISGNGDTTFI